jgi:hypothetical protein
MDNVTKVSAPRLITTRLAGCDRTFTSGENADLRAEAESIGIWQKRAEPVSTLVRHW